MNIIGDISGRYKTFLALLKKMPDSEVISLGDMIDRGPNSKQVLDWFIKNKQKAILGNHEHMMLDYYRQNTEEGYHRYYSSNVWGGLETLKSYNKDAQKKFLSIKEIIPASHIDYLKSLPLYLETPELLLSHGPKDQTRSVRDCANLGSGFWGRYHTPVESHSFIWNRLSPGPYENKIQIFGHNNEKNVLAYTPSDPKGLSILGEVVDLENLFAVCVDTSLKGDFLTGIHFPTLKVYRQDFLD